MPFIFECLNLQAFDPSYSKYDTNSTFAFLNPIFFLVDNDFFQLLPLSIKQFPQIGIEKMVYGFDVLGCFKSAKISEKPQTYKEPAGFKTREAWLIHWIDHAI